jgi:hypothetical protein
MGEPIKGSYIVVNIKTWYPAFIVKYLVRYKLWRNK